MAAIVKLFAGFPTYDGQRWNASALADVRQVGVDSMEAASSLLANAFNVCLAEALNRRSSGVTHFLLVHADVIPTDRNWPLLLHQEMSTHQAAVLSVMLPIKSETGLTSTALESSDRWRPRRLTVAEMHARPVTWTDPSLLINTGLLIVDIRQPWIERICFTINDTMRVDATGRWVAEVEPEDWHFSRQCRALGVPVWVTRRLSALHVGRKSYRNDVIYGAATDPTREA